MSVSSSSQSVQRPMISGFLLILIVVLLIVPHTLKIELSNGTDNSYVRCDLIALSWVLIRAYGSTIAGPLNTVSLSLPDGMALLWGELALAASILIFHAVRRISPRVPVGRLGWAVVAWVVLWVVILPGVTVIAAVEFWAQTVIPFALQQISTAVVAWYYPSDKQEGRET